MDWPAEQLGTLTKECIVCQAYKVETHIKTPLEWLDISHQRFNHIHIDLVGKLPPSKRFTHLLTIVNHFSYWPEAIPISDTTSASCAQTLISNWIARFGMLLDISSDKKP